MVKKYTEAQKELKMEINRKWREANREKIKEYDRKKRVENPEKMKEINRKRREEGRGKQRETNRKWLAANRERRWELNLMNKYGLEREQIDLMYKEQGGKCKICGTPKWSPSTLDTKAIDKLFIDHCHETDAVRGLICQHCNTMLGSAKDNTSTLQNAILYLEESKGGFDN